MWGCRWGNIIDPGSSNPQGVQLFKNSDHVEKPKLTEDCFQEGILVDAVCVNRPVGRFQSPWPIPPVCAISSPVKGKEEKHRN